jgi:peptidoglycan hydrolase CwlO-like protein
MTHLDTMPGIWYAGGGLVAGNYQLAQKGHLTGTWSFLPFCATWPFSVGDVAVVQAAVDAVEADVATLQSDMATVQGDVSTLSSDVSALDASVTALGQSLTTVKGNGWTNESLMAVKAVADSGKSGATSATAAVAVLTQQIKDVDNEIYANRADMTQYQDQIT